MGRRTETSYKAESLGKAAFMPVVWVPHAYAQGSGDTVNDAVA